MSDDESTIYYREEEDVEVEEEERCRDNSVDQLALSVKISLKSHPSPGYTSQSAPQKSHLRVLANREKIFPPLCTPHSFTNLQLTLIAFQAPNETKANPFFTCVDPQHPERNGG
eukprot:84559-Ditylum_brightwellii.AAC.1